MLFLTRIFVTLGLLALITGCSHNAKEDVPSNALSRPAKTVGGETSRSDEMAANVPGIYVADTGNSRIIHADDITGKNWTSFGTEGVDKGHFGSPNAVFLDSAGHIYIGDNPGPTQTGVHPRIIRIDDMSGKNWVSFDPVSIGKEPLSYISGLFVDKQNRIYATDMNLGQVVRIDDMTGKNYTAYGKSSLEAQGVGAFTTPTDVAVDSKGHIYVLEGSDLVRMDDMTGKGWTRFSAVNPQKLELATATKMCLDEADRIYIANKAANLILRIEDITGKNLAVFTKTQDGKSKLNQPYGVFVDKGGHVYITDGVGLDEKTGAMCKDERVVRIDDLTGKNWTAWGTQGKEKNQFAIPYSVFVR